MNIFSKRVRICKLVQHFNARTNFCFYFPINTFQSSFTDCIVAGQFVGVARLSWTSSHAFVHVQIWSFLFRFTCDIVFNLRFSRALSLSLSLSQLLQPVSVIIICTHSDLMSFPFSNRSPPPFYASENWIAKNKFRFLNKIVGPQFISMLHCIVHVTRLMLLQHRVHFFSPVVAVWERVQFSQ